MWLCILRTNWCLISALFLLFITYIMITIGAFTKNVAFDRIGGVFGGNYKKKKFFEKSFIHVYIYIYINNNVFLILIF